MNYMKELLNERSKTIVNNMVIKLLDEADFPKDQLEDWLTTEIGVTPEELEELKNDRPDIYDMDRNEERM